MDVRRLCLSCRFGVLVRGGRGDGEGARLVERAGEVRESAQEVRDDARKLRGQVKARTAEVREPPAGCQVMGTAGFEPATSRV